MSGDASQDAVRLWPELWAVQISVKADTIEHQMRVATAGRQLDARGEATKAAILHHLGTARRAVVRRRRLSRTPWDWWRGTAIQRAHQSLHAAEIFLVELLSDADVQALIPKVVARCNTVLQRDDPRRRDVDALPTMPPGARQRAALQRVMEIAYDASDQLHARVRDFRNVLLASALLITLLMTALVWIVAQHPRSMPLCFTPSTTAVGAEVGDGGEQACPSGDRQSPGGGDVLIVAGLGLLGGALAAAFGIRKLRGTSTPYGVPIAVALLKVPTGALTAVAGVLLLGGGFVPGLSQLDSQRQILAYALVFGYAQQLATRFIDDRAQTLLDSVPSKDPEAKQPTPSVLSPPSPPPTAPPAGRQAPAIVDRDAEDKRRSILRRRRRSQT